VFLLELLYLVSALLHHEFILFQAHLELLLSLPFLFLYLRLSFKSLEFIITLQISLILQSLDELLPLFFLFYFVLKSFEPRFLNLFLGFSCLFVSHMFFNLFLSLKFSLPENLKLLFISFNFNVLHLFIFKNLLYHVRFFLASALVYFHLFLKLFSFFLQSHIYLGNGMTQSRLLNR